MLFIGSARNIKSLASIARNSRYEFVLADIADQPAANASLKRVQRRATIHLKSESPRDQSLDGQSYIIHTGIVGTDGLLGARLSDLQAKRSGMARYCYPRHPVRSVLTRADNLSALRLSAAWKHSPTSSTGSTASTIGAWRLSVISFTANPYICSRRIKIVAILATPGNLYKLNPDNH